MINYIREWTSFLILAFVGIGIAAGLVEIHALKNGAEYFVAGIVIATAVSMKPKKLWYS